MRKTVVNGLIALCGGVAAAAGYLLVVLPWQQRWGATDEEVQRPLPGDDQIAHPDAQWTRAITVEARIAAVWPWLAQIGYGRGGYYSYPWLERLIGLRAAHRDHINPAWQDLTEGDIIPAEPDGSGYRVFTVEPGRTLLLGVQKNDEGAPRSVTGLYPAFTWVFVLEERETAQTHLSTRMRARTKHTPLAVLAMPFIDFGAFLLKRRMLLGIKQRAEKLGEQAEGDREASRLKNATRAQSPSARVLLTMGPDLVNKSERKQHLETVRPS